MSVSQPAVAAHPAVRRHLAPASQDRRLRLFLLGCSLAALGVSAISQVLAPPRGNPLTAWLVTVIVPALIVTLVLATPTRKVWLLIAAAILIYVEAILLATMYEIGIAFAILLPMVGIGLVQTEIRGWGKLAAYLGAVAVSTTAVAMAELGIPMNRLGEAGPVLPVTAFALVAGFALGLTWHASERHVEALASAEREIDARIDAEQLLGRTARFLEQLVSSSPVPTLALDSDGTVSVWNPAAERLFGWSAVEVVGGPPPFSDGDGDDAAALRDRVDRALLGKESHGEVVRGETKDGRQLLVEIHAASRRADDGGRLGAIVQAIDVTTRSELEAQLRQAQKMEAIGHLAGGIAHDMNNTLTAVGGFAQLIEEETTDPVVRGDAVQISAAVRRSSQLTTQLLAFARRSVLQPETNEVARFIATMRPMVQRLIGADIDIVLRDEAPGATIHVDPTGLEQALLNLAINARDAMPSGGKLTVACARRAAPPDASDDPTAPESTDRIVISVTDTGSGIPEELQDQVFEPFFTTKGQGKGTGLGLPMVYGFVTQSGGAISLESQPGAGTTIEIQLPEAGDPATPVRSAAPSGESGRETILLVEDEPSVASFGVRVLERLGYTVLDARDGDQAMAIARSHSGPISLILTDVIMPGRNGPEVAETVREIHPEAAVLFASGYTADAIEGRRALPPGAELMTKPYSATELARRVRLAVDQAAAAADRAAPAADQPTTRAG